LYTMPAILHLQTHVVPLSIAPLGRPFVNVGYRILEI
jgi:hypothetical protein